ncbi:uncharacterized protein LOC101857522 [Aplysia californica]|uniref:Uncharacterized protein LOC101857522 n=1 Tax=Aplysia californica TaxID=6500 RepID=A0ABM1ABW9_APLCA|nr:uncharacterized protein LOC101857522 [Aplysia californica]
MTPPGIQLPFAPKAVATPYPSSALLAVSSIWVIYGLALNSCCIAVFICAERCLCIALPFKVRDILTPGRSAAILALICTFSLASVSPILSTVELIRTRDPETNTTVVNMFLTRENPPRVQATNATVSTAQTTALLCLLLLTGRLVISLNRHTKWRSLHSQAGVRAADRRVVKVVVIVSVVLMVCYTPGQIYTAVSEFAPEFNYGRRHGYLYRASWALAYFLYTLNSSINLVIYYNMSSRYRATLQALLHF